MLRVLLRSGLNIMNPIRGMAGIMTVLMVIATFTFGGLGGASAALNESKSPDSYRAEIDTVDDEVRADIRANHSEPMATLTIGFVQVPMWMALESAKVGVGIGHAYPGAMEAWATVAPAVMVGVVLVGLLRQWRRIRGTNR